MKMKVEGFYISKTRDISDDRMMEIITGWVRKGAKLKSCILDAAYDVGCCSYTREDIAYFGVDDEGVVSVGDHLLSVYRKELKLEDLEDYLNVDDPFSKIRPSPNFYIKISGVGDNQIAEVFNDVVSCYDVCLVEGVYGYNEGAEEHYEPSVFKYFGVNANNETLFEQSPHWFGGDAEELTLDELERYFKTIVEEKQNDHSI